MPRIVKRHDVIEEEPYQVIYWARPSMDSKTRDLFLSQSRDYFHFDLQTFKPLDIDDDLQHDGLWDASPCPRS